jgi:hypothetical protein
MGASSGSRDSSVNCAITGSLQVLGDVRPYAHLTHGLDKIPRVRSLIGPIRTWPRYLSLASCPLPSDTAGLVDRLSIRACCYCAIIVDARPMIGILQ